MKQSKLKTAEDLYEAIDQLGSMLEHEGLDRHQANLADLVHNTAWTTGSELLGELNQYLSKINEPLSTSTSQLLTECKYFCSNHRRIMGIEWS